MSESNTSFRRSSCRYINPNFVATAAKISFFVTMPTSFPCSSITRISHTCICQNVWLHLEASFLLSGKSRFLSCAHSLCLLIFRFPGILLYPQCSVYRWHDSHHRLLEHLEILFNLNISLTCATVLFNRTNVTSFVINSYTFMLANAFWTLSRISVNEVTSQIFW